MFQMCNILILCQIVPTLSDKKWKIKINGDVFSLKNKIFKISWVFEPSRLTERDKKCYIYNNFTKNPKWLIVNSG